MSKSQEQQEAIDHSNGRPRPQRPSGYKHSDGGYALKQEWL